METSQVISPAGLWTASGLSPKVRRLRDQYFSFYERHFTNEVRSYITGTSAYFVGLGKEVQDEIIARESHQLG